LKSVDDSYNVTDGYSCKDISKIQSGMAKSVEQQMAKLKLHHLGLEQIKEIQDIIKVVTQSKVATVSGLVGGSLEHHV
jgi:hypothetical protein